MENYYEILHITQLATYDEIRTSYRKLAHQFHPDKNKDSYAKEQFIKINIAYQTLINPLLREEYDSKLIGNQKPFQYSKKDFNKKQEEFRREAEDLSSKDFESFRKTFESAKTTFEKIQAGCGCLIMFFIVWFPLIMLLISTANIFVAILVYSFPFIGLYLLFKILKDK